MTVPSVHHRQFVIATAGHVDHGKSSLVRALTGTDPDRLPEEKARGITIDLGFAHMTLASPEADQSFNVSIIDVPGHEDLVRNMISGVGCIDAVLLVIAADDGWMPQTQEHLEILTYLAVTRGVIAVTKKDLASDISAVIAAIQHRLIDSPFQHAPIIPISTSKPEGLDELRAALAKVLHHAPSQLDFGKPRLAVDRAFALKGIGTVVTGTLRGGSVSCGEQLIVHPRKTRARVRTVQSHSKQLHLASPGTRVALNLPDLYLGRDGSIQRADVLTSEQITESSDRLYVHLHRLKAIQSSKPPLLHHGKRLWFHHLASAIPARVRLVDVPSLDSGQSCYATLTLERPTCPFIGDRFILRDWSSRYTIAGGVVLWPNLPKKTGLTPQIHQCMRRRHESLSDLQTLIETELQLNPISQETSFLSASNFSATQLMNCVEQLETRHLLARSQGWIISSQLLDSLEKSFAEAIDAHHRTHPEQAGFPLKSTRQVISDLPRTDPRALLALESILLKRLTEIDFSFSGTCIRRNSHRPSLPGRLAPFGENIRRALGRNPLDPPSKKQLCSDDLSHQALRFLILSGEVVELSADIVISADSYLLASTRIQKYLEVQRVATVAELKSVIGTTRRLMVPLLERLDKDGITKRRGNLRELNPENLS